MSIKSTYISVKGPVYNVERQHQFPKDVPKREQSAGKDDLKFPVMGVESKHSFKASSINSIVCIVLLDQASNN